MPLNAYFWRRNVIIIALLWWFNDGSWFFFVHFFVSFQDEEDIGDVYQDEINQAAMLLYKDRDDDALLMVSYGLL